MNPVPGIVAPVESLNAASRRAHKAAEAHLERLTAEYHTVIARAGRHAAQGFSDMNAHGLVAADPPPGWKDVPAEDLVDVTYVKSQLVDETRATRTAAAQDAMLPLMQALGISFTLAPPMVADLVARSGRRAANMSVPGILDAVMAAIRQGFEEGLSVPQVAQLIRSKCDDLAGYQAEMLARTDLIGTANGGSIIAAKTVYPEGTLTKSWLNATDSRVINDGRIRPTHLEANAQQVGLDDHFVVGDDKLLFPGDPDGSDAEVINCLPADTVVDFPSLRGVTRRWYEGDLITVRTAAGHVLSGTPNHPILGPNGWVPIGAFEKGDYLVCGTFGGDDAGAPHEDRPPSTIGDVYRLACIGGEAHRVGGSEPDFHGDGKTGEVEVVPVDRSLLIDTDSLDAEDVAELALALADLAVWGLPGDESGSWTLDPSSASSGVRSAREVASLVGGQPRHADRVGFRAGTNGQVEIAEAADDDGTTYSERAAHREHTLSVRVALAKVIEVERETYHGYVFNLDTGVGVYSANGIIAANCRCTLIYAETEPDVLTAAPSGVSDGHWVWSDEPDDVAVIADAWDWHEEDAPDDAEVAATVASTDDPEPVVPSDPVPVVAAAPAQQIVLQPQFTIVMPEYPKPPDPIVIPAPVVTVEAPPPAEVNVTVEAPPPAEVNVTVAAAEPIVIPAPEVTVQSPNVEVVVERQPARKVEFERDAGGRIVSADITEEES